MSIEVIGLFTHRDASETHPRPMGEVDTDFIRRAALGFERNGFDRILIAQAASWPDGIVFASYVAAVTTTLKFMIAHRPGFIAPTMAARMLATIDQVSHGRAAVHIISAANDVETQADGDFLTRDERHIRSGEYIDIMRRVWAGETFDHDGPHYRFRGAYSAVSPARPQEGIPVYFGGLSENGLAIAGSHADVYAFGVKTVEESRELIDSVRAEAAKHGRSPRFCMSTRIILGDTEAQAWAKADAVLRRVLESMGAPPPEDPAAPDREALIAQGAVQDERLWIAVSKATNFQKASTTLVGTPQNVVDALVRYHQIGVTSFLISGYDLLPDQEVFGRDLIPLLRARTEGAL